MEKDYINTLSSLGAKNIKQYCLVNNWGFTYDLNDVHYDSRFWENCYGAYVGYFITIPKNDYIDKVLNK